ncbi:MAG TPA: response regulator transcription factor [Epsilonproteobacteria bacterium]|nr:response regulator transcription factor [Campylobacterota bacterium]
MNLEALTPLTILYVEDEPLIRQNAVEYLSRYCNKVYEAQNGLEGLEVYNTHKPDLIISDIKMPKLSGLEFASKIRQNDKNTPIIITTAHTDTEYLLKAVELQLIKYLIKPITSDKLQEALLMACQSLESNNIGLITLDEQTRYDTLNQTLIKHNRLVKLTHNELLFFDFLVKHKQRAITYEEIENIIWAYEGMSMDALRSLVRGLRKKLEGNYIENISGIGYRLMILENQH